MSFDRPDHKAEIRRRLNEPAEVARLLGLRGMRPQGRGGVSVICPAHDDRGPSCSLTVGQDGTLQVRCFGCHLAGDVLTLVAAVEGLSIDAHFAEVLRIAGDFAGVDVRGEAPRIERRPRPVRPEPPPRFDLHPLVLPLARLGGLASSSAAGAYLDRRGLRELAEAAGFFALPPHALEVLEPAFGRVALEASGLVREGRWSWPLHTLCIPWRSHDGRISTLQRRHLDQPQIDRAAPRYVTPRGLGPVSPFGAEQLTGAPANAPIAICEGALDAIALGDLARDMVVLGIQGCRGWRLEWDALVKGRAVFLAFDRDEEGDQAALELVDRLDAASAKSVQRLRPPAGTKDWASAYVRRRREVAA